MGLLDNIAEFASSPEGRGFAGGLLSGGFGAGAIGMNNARAREQEFALRKQMHDAQMQEIQAHAMQRQAAIQREQEMLAAAKRKQEALPSLFGGGVGSGPTGQVNAALPPELRMGAQQALPNSGGIDWRQGLAAGYTPEELTKMAALRNINQEKVARTIDGKDEQGRPVTYQLDDFGRRVGGAPIEQWKAPIQIGTGDKQNLVDPVNNQIRASFAMGQSPDSAADSALGWANYNTSRQRLAMDAANQDKPQYVAELGGFVSPRSQQFMPVKDAQGRPMEGAGPKMTEDQAKATGWLVQAENAYGNMKKAMDLNKDAKTPGLRETIAMTPYIGGGEGAANAMRSPERQMFVQGASELSEAFLRAATGAGVNKDEALQKMRALVPQFTDSEELKQQKMEQIPIYLEGLKVRAGSGAKKAAAITSGGSSGGWSIQKVN